MEVTDIDLTWLRGPYPGDIKGAMNGEAFLAYIEQCLAPTLKRGDIVVADNVSFHKVAGVEEVLRGVSASLVVPPNCRITVRVTSTYCSIFMKIKL
jgi:transposase